MSIVTLPSLPPAGSHSTLTQDPDVDFERRWTTWKARGLAHDRTVRQRFIIVAIIAGATAVAAIITYGLLAP